MKKISCITIIALLSLSFLTGVPVLHAERSDSVLQNNEEATVISFSLPHIACDDEDTAGYRKLSAERLSTISQPGSPGVLMHSVLLEIPCDSNVEVLPIVEKKETFSDFLLAPAPTQIVQDDEHGGITLGQIFEKNEDAYAKNAFYPGTFAEIEYTGFLRDKRVAKINIYPVQYNPVSRELLLCKKMIVNVRYTHGESIQHNVMQSRPAGKFSGVVREKGFEGIYKKALLNYTQESASVYSAAADKREQRPSLSDGIAGSPFAVKAVIAEKGIYKITYEELAALGINLSGATNENLAMENQGKEIAIYCSGSGSFTAGDHILFYGQAFKSLYSKTNVYWLYQKSGQGKRMAQRDGSLNGTETAQSSFQTTLHFEEDLIYWSNIPPYAEGVDHWFWEKLSIIEQPLQKNFTVSLGALEKNAGSFSMTINMQGQTGTSKNPDHHTKIYVNGNLAADFTWDGQIELTQDIPGISPTFFKDGENIITIEAVADTGSTVDSYYINWIDITCYKKYTATDERLAFYNQTTGAAGFSVGGFSTTQITCLDVTDPGEPVFITNVSPSGQAPSITLRFQDTISGRTAYFAASSQGYRTPAGLLVDTASNLTAYRSDIDYIIITHEDFYDAVTELKSYRESKRLRVEVVKIQDIYDEFSYGIKDAQAIRDFLTFAYNNWNSTGHPEYVLLVGDASLDYRDDYGLYAQGQIDYVPTYIYQTNQFGNTPTDNWFACVSGNDYLPDMIIGRICIRNSEDLRNVIAKIKKYENAQPAAWCGNIILAADNESIFESMSDSLVAMLPEGFQARKVYLDTYATVKDATADLIAKINAGALITNYAGHGNIDEWAAEYLFHTNDQRKSNTRDDLKLLTNGDKLTFVMALNCLNGYFPNWVDDYSLAEDFLRVENKGAIACFAPTALGYPSEHQVLARRIFSGLFNDENNIVGSLVTAAKIGTYTQINSRDIVETFTLFGDPATELKLVSGSDFTTFKSVSPSDGEAVTLVPPPTFSWGTGLYDRFKVQFSKTTDFSPETTITAPLLPMRFLTGNSYTPPLLIWFFVNMMASQGGQMYWRVAAYDENFNQMATTDPARFMLQR